MSVLAYTFISLQTGLLLFLAPYWWGALAVLIIGGVVLLRRQSSKPRTHRAGAVGWFLLLVPPLALNGASAAFQGSLIGHADSFRWQDALSWLLALIELGLGLWLVARGRGPTWMRMAWAASGLWVTLAAGAVHWMATHDVWL